jgi:uncharacterized protein with GYD domain
MAKFAVFFSYSADAWKSMLDNPSDRTAAARKITEAVGGTLESMYWMLGDYDGFAIADVDDSLSAAAISVAISSSGAFTKVSTHELLDADARDKLIDKARTALGAYTSPTG